MPRKGTFRLTLLVIFILLCALAALIAGRLAHGCGTAAVLHAAQPEGRPAAPLEAPATVFPASPRRAPVSRGT